MVTSELGIRVILHIQIWAERGERPTSSLVEVARSREYGLWKAHGVREEDGSLILRLPYVTEAQLESFECYLVEHGYIRVDPGSGLIKGPRYTVW